MDDIVLAGVYYTYIEKEFRLRLTLAVGIVYYLK